MLRHLLLITALSVSAAAAQAPPPNPVSSKPEVKRTYTLPPDKLEKAIEYSSARNRLHFIGVAWSVLVLAGILAWRVAPRFRDWAEAASRRRILQAYIFAPLLLAVDIGELPVSIYSQHLSLKYEQSIQGWGSWFWAGLKPSSSSLS